MKKKVIFLIILILLIATVWYEWPITEHIKVMGDVYAEYDYDLVVCGHAHGGQWKIPFTQCGVAAPNQGLLPKFVDGAYKLSNGADMVVSRGLCRERMPYPRFFNHPEIVIIDVE